MEVNRSIRLRLVVTVLLATLMAVSSGCVGWLAQILYWNRGATVPAEFTGLKGKRVAVVCVSDASSYGVGTEAETLARGVGVILKQHVKDIEVVRWGEIADWIDKNSWDETDYREVGRGVKADLVLAIDLAGFQLYEGKTLYKGRANLTVTVFDMADGGKESFRRSLTEITFPVNGVYHATDTSEAKFRRAFLQVLAQQAAKYFYDYDIVEDFGRDPVMIGS